MAVTTVEEFMIDINTRMHGADQKTLAKIGDTFKGFLSTFGKLAGVTGGIYGIGSAVKDFVTNAVELQRVSNIVGSTVENMSTWVGAINAAGENGDEFIQTVKGIASNLRDAFMGSGSDLVPYFAKLGIQLLDTNNNLRDTTEIVGDLAKAWEKYSPQEQQKIGEMIGIDDSTIRFLQKGGDEVERLLEVQRKLGIVTDEQAKSSKTIQTNYYQLQQIWTAVSNKITASLLPSIEGITEALKEASYWLADHEEIVMGVLTTIGTALAVVAVSWLASFAPIVALIAVLSALSTAIYYLIDDFQVWREGGEAAFTGLWEAINPFIETIEHRIDQLRVFLLGVWNDPVKAWNDAVDYFKTRWEGMSLLEIGKDIITSLWNGIKSVWNNFIIPFVLTIDGVFKEHFGFSLIEIGSGIINSLWEGIKSAWTAVDLYISGLYNQIMKRWEGMSLLEIGWDIITSLWNGIKSAWNNYLVPFALTVDGFFQENFGFSLIEVGRNGINSLWEGIKSAWTAVSEYISGLYSKMSAMFWNMEWGKLGHDLGVKVVEAITSAWSWLTSPSSIDWAGIASMIGDGLWTVLKVLLTFVGSIGQFVGGLISGILDGVWAEIKKEINNLLSYVGLGKKEEGIPAGAENASSVTGMSTLDDSAVNPQGGGIQINPNAIGGFSAASDAGRAWGAANISNYNNGGDINIQKMEINTNGPSKQSVTEGVKNGLAQFQQRLVNSDNSTN